MRKNAHFAGNPNDVRTLLGGMLVPVTLSDSTDDPHGPFRGILIDGSTALAIKLAAVGQEDTEAVTITNFALGVPIPLSVRRVFETGTNPSVVVYGIL